MPTTSAREIHLVPLVDLDVESQLKVREIRNEDDVRGATFTDHVIGVNEHLDWIRALKSDESKIVFAVLDHDRVPLGATSVSGIDRRHRKADWGFYLTAGERGGLGSAILYELICFVFDALGMEKLNCEVVAGNDSAAALYRKIMFQEEGFRRSNVMKQGARIGVRMLGLTKDEWAAGRAHLRERLGPVLARFSVSIHWPPPAKAEGGDTLDRIEAARARNNLNWMGILRLALEKSPENAKAIVSEIRRIDREISELTQKLIT